VDWTWREVALSGKPGLDIEESRHDDGLDGDHTSGQVSREGATSLGLDAGTTDDITRSETRHVGEGKSDAVVTATRGDDVHSADDEALRDSDGSPTNTLLN